ncbi:MAG: cytochrome c oxidase subunit II [Micavibrio sp.]|nr:cytochrome c oxidase subunit II [Micavibrio sp.]|tara:strand:- start:802 stop:1668 length:867 start_codon:yes stop_codon:yes gene_type:complete
MIKTFLTVLFTTFIASLPAAAQAPVNWGMDLQTSFSPVKERMHDFHTMLLYIITAIVLFVLFLLLYVIFRFNKKANPTPSKFTHNTLIEVVWTAIPVIILMVIAVPSFKLLFYGDRTPDPEMTLKVTGYQWYWGYEYPDFGDISFSSYMIPDDEIKEGQLRLLETDKAVVLPIETNIQILVTAADVLHSFAMPAFGVKTDAVPGRLNETWTYIEKEGTYYGQCSEICGTNHAFMPIMIKAVSKEDFAAWVKEQGGTMPADKSANDNDKEAGDDEHASIEADIAASLHE